MSKDGKWRFTSPTHVVLAFAQAIKELKAEGGIVARNKRYSENNRILIEEMAKLGIKPYIESTHQGPIITTSIIQKIVISILLKCINILKTEDMLFIQVK